MEAETNESGTTSIQAETLTQNSDEDWNKSQNCQEAEQPVNAESETCDVKKTEEDLIISGVETSLQETRTATNTQDDDDFVPQSSPLTEKEANPPLVSSHPSSSQDRPSEPCWYCLRSLDSEFRLEASKQEDSDSASTLLSSGQPVSYQTDPRPHFGVACSSRSTCHPLWGSEGPCSGLRNQEVPDQTDTCPHCHLGLPLDTLRWHEAKCMLYDGLRNLKK